MTSCRSERNCTKNSSLSGIENSSTITLTDLGKSQGKGSKGNGKFGLHIVSIGDDEKKIESETRQTDDDHLANSKVSKT